MTDSMKISGGVKNPLLDNKKSPDELKKMFDDILKGCQEKRVSEEIATGLNKLAQGTGTLNPEIMAKLVDSVNEQAAKLDPQQKTQMFKQVFDFMVKDAVKATGDKDESTAIHPAAIQQTLRKSLEALGDSRADLKMDKTTLNTIFPLTQADKGAQDTGKNAGHKEGALHVAYTTSTYSKAPALTDAQKEAKELKALDTKTQQLFQQGQISTLKLNTPPAVFRLQDID